MAETVDERKQECSRIAEQNDAFRSRRAAGGEGKWVWTQAIDAEGADFLRACLLAVEAYDDFTEENDPFGTHEMGFMEVAGRKVWWKIDLYDRAYRYGSSNPSSVAETRRVLTILFPSDY